MKHSISWYVDDDVKDGIDRMAKMQGVSSSQLVNSILRGALGSASDAMVEIERLNPVDVVRWLARMVERDKRRQRR